MTETFCADHSFRKSWLRHRPPEGIRMSCPDQPRRDIGSRPKPSPPARRSPTVDSTANVYLNCNKHILVIETVRKRLACGLRLGQTTAVTN